VERRVSREKAAGLLWSERNEEAAHKNLRNALGNLIGVYH